MIRKFIQALLAVWYRAFPHKDPYASLYKPWPGTRYKDEPGHSCAQCGQEGLRLEKCGEEYYCSFCNAVLSFPV